MAQERSPQSEGLLTRLFGRLWQRPADDFAPQRGTVTHVIILDGTLSSQPQLPKELY